MLGGVSRSTPNGNRNEPRSLRKQFADGVAKSREDQPLARIRPAARNRTVSFSNCREQGRRASDVWGRRFV